jgi:hypothetical protein
MTRARLAAAAALTLLATVLSVLPAQAASAAPQKKLDATLAALWTAVLQTPAAENSFGTGGHAFDCWDLGGTVAPFHPVGAISCTVKPSTKLSVVGFSVECSTFEGNGTTEAALRTCARNANQIVPTVTLDGRPAPVAEAETPLLRITLPADNVFGLPAGDQGLSVGHGWVVLLHPLTPGTHTLVIRTGTLDPVTTQIVVTPGHK